MFSLAVFVVVIAAAMAKPTDSVVSVSQDSLGNYDIKYAIDGHSKVEQRSVHGAVLRTAPTLIAEPKIELPSYKVIEVQQVPAVRTSHFTSVQQEVPVVAEPKIELVEVPSVRTAHIAEPNIQLVQVPEVRSNHFTLQQDIPLLAEHKVLEVPAVRTSHVTVQKEIPLEIPTYRVLEIPQTTALRSSHLTVHPDSQLLSLPTHSYLRTVPEAHISHARHFGF